MTIKLTVITQKQLPLSLFLQITNLISLVICTHFFSILYL